MIPTGDTDSVVNVLKKLISDRTELSRLQEGARQTADNWPSWHDSSALFCEWVEKCLEGPLMEKSIFTELTVKAFNEYSAQEKQRLNTNRWVVRRHKLSALSARLPESLKLRIKQLEAVGEVIFGGREVR